MGSPRSSDAGCVEGTLPSREVSRFRRLAERDTQTETSAARRPSRCLLLTARVVECTAHTPTHCERSFTRPAQDITPLRIVGESLYASLRQGVTRAREGKVVDVLLSRRVAANSPDSRFQIFLFGSVVPPFLGRAAESLSWRSRAAGRRSLSFSPSCRCGVVAYDLVTSYPRYKLKPTIAARRRRTGADRALFPRRRTCVRDSL